MASIGTDLKEVLQEVGVAFSILRDGTTIGTEYCAPQANKQGSKPFNSEHLFLAQLFHDTAAVKGDLLHYTVTGDNFFLVTKNPEIFENAVIANNCILYKTNAVASFSRVTTGTRNLQTYQMEEAFVSYKTAIPVLAADKMYGSTIDEAQSIGELAIRSNEVYVPAFVAVKSLDRIAFSSTEYYKVEQIETRRFGGSIWVLTVTEDTRGS